MQLDGQSYQKVGKVSFTLGTGEGASGLTFLVYRDPAQRLVYLHKDGQVYRLYTLAQPPDQRMHSVDESETASHFKGHAEMQGKAPEVRWGRFQKACQLEGPFFGSKDAFQLAESGRQLSFSATTLVEDRPGKWYSPNFSAAELPQCELPLRPNSPLDWLSLVFFVLAGILLWAAWHQDQAAMSLFWWYCGILALGRAGRNPGRLAADLLGAGFGFHFMSYALDIYLLKGRLEFEVLKFCALILVLLALRWSDRRLYSCLYLSGIQAGLASWAIWTVGLGIWCSFDEYNYFPWFAEYAGSLPWCLAWPLVWFYYFKKVSQDFSLAPLHYRGFCQLLHRLTKGLKQPPKAVVSAQAELLACCDDLEDSLRLSGDPKLRLISGYAEELLRLQKMLHQLIYLQQPGKIEADLQTLVEDLENLRQVVDQGQGPLKSLRLSPYLRTREA
jgi:hypothetical protein